jgi:hypothetical protein
LNPSEFMHFISSTSWRFLGSTRRHISQVNWRNLKLLPWMKPPRQTESRFFSCVFNKTREQRTSVNNWLV